MYISFARYILLKVSKITTINQTLVNASYKPSSQFLQCGQLGAQGVSAETTTSLGKSGSIWFFFGMGF
jgi:hypothetical protein